MAPGVPPLTEAVVARARCGEQAARDAVFQSLYREIHRLAKIRLRGERIDPPATTSLVHEAYLRLDPGLELRSDEESRRYVLAAAWRVLYQILVDRARSRLATKRACTRVPLEGDLPEAERPLTELVALDQALQALARRSSSAAEVAIHLHVFGRTLDETADLMELPAITVRRRWKTAKAFLRRRLENPAH